MDRGRDSKRRKERHDDSDDYRKERSYKKRRSKSRSPNDRDSRRKRRHSRSKSPNIPAKQDKRRDDAPKDVETKSELPPRKTKETDMLNTRTGGAYIPPARLRMMQAQITDKSSVAYQRLAWEALKKSIHGHINKINVGNIGIIIKELLKENIVRGRGLLCRSVIQAQAASPTFTNVYAALVAAVNSRFPNIGELLLKRLVIQFKRGFKRNDKSICISSASFIAHLVNQRVAHEILALELLTLLVETPTDDSVEVAIAFLKECGQKLTEVSSKGVNAIFEMLRNILHEGQLDKRVQYMIEVMFQVWKDGFKDHPAVVEELELVPEEEQFTHLLMLDDATDAQDILNVFKFDDKYEENEQKYKGLCKEILGSDAESGEENGSGESGSEESDEEEEEEKEKAVTIIDNTETNLVALRRTIYLTINSSLDFEECAHKLMKMQLKPGQEVELCHMFLDCCAEQRTYEKFYGLLAQRFCNINRIYIGPFEEIFKDSYSTAHRLDTNRLRNVSKFFAHLLFTDSISWEALECVKLNEEDTTSSSRIYIKILFQELAEYMGLKKLNDRLKDPTLQEAFSGIFPRDNPKNTRFSINFFTSIGLGGLTDELREHLKQMPKNVPPQITEIKLDSDSDSSSSSSSDSSSSSSSDSSSSESEAEEKGKDKKKKKKNKSKTPEPEVTNKESDKSERWGHDGFYDTYGKDARRNDPRSDRHDNDDNFRKPRNDYRNDDRRRNDYEQRNGNQRYDKHRDDRRERESEKTAKDPEINRRDRRRSDDDKSYREDESSSRKRDDRDRIRDERNEKRKEQDEPKRRNERELNEEYSKRKNDRDYERRNAKYRDDDRRKRDNNRNSDESRNDPDLQRHNYRDEQNGKDRDRERKEDSEYSRKKPDNHSDRLDSRYEDGRNNRVTDENSQRGQNDKEFRKGKDRYDEQNSRNKRDNTDFKRKQGGDSDNRKRMGRERDEDRSRRVDEDKRNQRDERKRYNDDDSNEEDSRNHHVKSKRDDENKRSYRNDYDKNKSVKEVSDDDDDSRNRISKTKRDKRNDEERGRYKDDRDRNKKSNSSEDEDSDNHKRKKDKKKDTSSKGSKIKRDKEKRKNKENIVKDSGSVSDSSDEYDKKKDKNVKYKKRDKDIQIEKVNIKNVNPDSDHSDDAQRDLGGRYWDNFDIESKKSATKEMFEGRTPEKVEKIYEKRRER